MKGTVVTFAVLNAIHGFYAGIFWPAQSIIYKSRFQLGYSEIGLLNSVFIIAQIFGLYLSSRIVSRFKTRWIMVVSATVSALAVLSYSVIDSTMWLIPLSLVNGFTLSFGFQSPMGSAILMNNVQASMRGTVQGVIGTLWRAGMASGNLAMGNVWAFYGLTTIPVLGSISLIIESILIFARLP